MGEDALKQQMAADKEQAAKQLGDGVTGCEKSLAELKTELMGSDGADGESKTSLGGLEKALAELQKQTAADKEQEAKELSEAVEARDKSLAELKAELMGADGGDGKTSLGGLEKALTELQKQTAADKEQEAKDLSEAVTGCEKSLAELKAELMGAE